MAESAQEAPGRPGDQPHWTSGAKCGIGTSINRVSRVWFTLGQGVITEVYYPEIDKACTRDMGFVVTDGASFFSDEKSDVNYAQKSLAEGVLAYHLTNTCKHGRYRIEKEVLCDPQLDVVLQRTVFTPLQGEIADYHLYLIVAPHLGNYGTGNTAWIGEYKGHGALFAKRGDVALAVVSTAPWLKRSAGFVGRSDGWTDVRKHGVMAHEYAKATDGSVALTGEIDMREANGPFTFALGFGTTCHEAANHALASLADGFDPARREYVDEWTRWQKTVPLIDTLRSDRRDISRASAAVLRACESKGFPGCSVASLAIPWGTVRGDDNIGGYHLLWPRDLVEASGAMLAIGNHNDIRRELQYLDVTQESDGHWPQNMWLDGRPYLDAVQLDETALPVLLLDTAHREKAVTRQDIDRFWPVVRKAAFFIARTGPVTDQDRWEEDPGYSPYTLAVEVSALLVAADFADMVGEPATGAYLRETADAWNDRIETWAYATGTDLADRLGIDGYYVRLAAPDTPEHALRKGEPVVQDEKPSDGSSAPPADVVSPGALALVRYGLRAADDPRILDTIKAIDALLKVDTPTGPVWRRYNGDRYGEHEDGTPFDQSGVGRAWPLLTGERAHYEIAAGRIDEARKLLHAMESFANEAGFLPEQVWDAPDIPEKELYFGRPTGSAMPLVWAHAEYLKLLRSLHDKRVFDMHPTVTERYLKKRVHSHLVPWRYNNKARSIPAGRTLRIEVLSPATIRWSANDWRTFENVETADSGIGLHYVDLPTKKLHPGTNLAFSFFWHEAGHWEGKDFDVLVVSRESGQVEAKFAAAAR